MTDDDAKVPPQPITQRYRPRRYEDFYQGLDASPVNILVAQEIGPYYLEPMLFTGSKGAGKTSAARVRGARLACSRRAEHRRNPCGECDGCLTVFGGEPLTFPVYHEFDATRPDLYQRVKSLLQGGEAYGGIPHDREGGFQHVVAIDEAHRAFCRRRPCPATTRTFSGRGSPRSTTSTSRSSGTTGGTTQRMCCWSGPSDAGTRWTSSGYTSLPPWSSSWTVRHSPGPAHS